MDKHLKLKDIIPYFNGDDEVLQVSTDGWDSEECDIFHADSRLLRVFSDWDIVYMGSVGESVIRVLIKKGEAE